MITFSFLMEGIAARQKYLNYKPKHPFLYYGTIIGSGLGGTILGYNAGENIFDMKHPSVGGVIGALNGINAGSLAAEYLDRKLREREGNPYTGPREMSDAENEFLLKTGLSNLAAGSVAATGTSSIFLPAIAGRIGNGVSVILNDKIRHPERHKKKKK